MDLIVVIECGADEMMTVDYYRKSFNLDIFRHFFDDVKIMGHIRGADIYTKNINSRKFGAEGKKIIRELAEEEKFAIYSAPIYWGPYMTKGLDIKTFVRYGLSFENLKICKKEGCNHVHYLRYFLAKYLRNYFWHKNVYFIAVSKYLQNELLNLGVKKEKTTQIYAVPDTKTYTPLKTKRNKKSGKFLFPYIIQDLKQERKKPETILDAAKLLDKDILQDVSFVCTGHNQKWFTSKLGEMKKYFDLPGIISANKLINLYRKSYYGLHPTVTEGFPRTIFEGMACGLPFIANPIGGIPEVVDRDTGFLFDRSGELAELITYVIENPKIRVKMSKNCRKRIVEIEKPIVKQYEELFTRTGVL